MSGQRIKLFSEVPHIENNGLVLRRITDTDADDIMEIVSNDNVYRYLPTFLFERQYSDMHLMISELYGELFTGEGSLILGISEGGTGRICGLAEFYGYNDSIHKISIGYRLNEKSWGRGIATGTVSSMVSYLYSATDIEIITASTMVENKASAKVLQKNGFDLVVSAVGEDWGYDKPTIADKWIR